ncbi:MAG TPA: hypothetical protein VM124_01940, partial [Candidatus Limnocylindrales bacterium]|nr:hypothetical protein [Candidatus Limnocylindrales bacterium]
MPKPTKTNRLVPVAFRTLGIVRFVLFFVALTGVFLYTRMGTPARVQAATSSTLNFQARLLTGAGGIVADGSYNVQFNLYNVSSGGSSLWSETYYDSNGVTAGNDNRVNVRAGYLSVSLGSQTAFPALNWDQDLWLTMNIGGT